ncbi:hypothetical protein [Kordia sp.]|uniref:hypothetical protein n=1 Tax=Kordia sp. TaxID=1965332 RepID=UPI003D2A85CF
MKSIILLSLLFFNFNLSATATKIIVRAKAKDAKFVGSSLGGAYIIIRNKTDNSILAKGKTNGSTGNTDLIMRTPRERGKLISDAQTAQFLATIDIEEPTFIRIEVISPYNHKQAQSIVSTELWLIPGKDILGDGIILEIPGFIIDILKPRTHQYIALKDVQNKVFELKANVVMMCGCTINSGGIWDSENMEVTAILKKDGKHLKNVEMSITETNLFEGSIKLTSAGQYEIIIYAYNAKSGNTGVDKVNYVIYE